MGTLVLRAGPCSVDLVAAAVLVLDVLVLADALRSSRAVVEGHHLTFGAWSLRVELVTPLRLVVVHGHVVMATALAFDEQLTAGTRTLAVFFVATAVVTARPERRALTFCKFLIDVPDQFESAGTRTLSQFTVAQSILRPVKVIGQTVALGFA